MKVYKTIKAEDVEGYGLGWNIEKMFMQRVPERVMTQESHPAPPPVNGYSQSQYPQTTSVEKVVMSQRMFVLLSRDAEVVTRESQLQNQVAELLGDQRTAKLLIDKQDRALKKLDADLAAVCKERDDIAIQRTEDKDRDKAISDELKNRANKLDKIKVAIGELRFREILGVDEAQIGENPSIARFRQIELSEKR